MSDDFIHIVNPIEGSEPEIILPAGRAAQGAARPLSDSPRIEYVNQTSILSQTPREQNFHEASEALRQAVAADTDNTNKHFKGQQKNETVYCFSRKHWIVLFPHFLGFLCFLVLMGVFLFSTAVHDAVSLLSVSTYRFFALIALAGLTFYLHRFFLRIFNFYLQIFVITNFRIINLDQTLYLVNNRDSIDLREIQDIVISKSGILQTLLNYGSITITLSSAHATKILNFVQNPEYYFRKINNTKREYISSRRIPLATASAETVNGKTQ